jgi:lipopolysaccharide/colanic/teichoic acid biosynthesis glycosyltransferase
MQQVIDRLLAAVGLVVLSPILLPVMFLVWWQDKHSPFYVAERVGKDERGFRMVKLRSMVINADKSGVDSTANNDRRITRVGHFIRRFKLDEIMQLYNVLKGDMALVGPRPNVRRETDLYTKQEKRLLTVRPGITDLSSIVFSDEGSILEGTEDPDIAYNQLIRPGKSLLGLFYIDNRSFWMDLRIIVLTVMAVLSRRRALNGVVGILRELDAPTQLIEIAARDKPLLPAPPPGAKSIVTNREGRVEEA